MTLPPYVYATTANIITWDSVYEHLAFPERPSEFDEDIAEMREIDGSGTPLVEMSWEYPKTLPVSDAFPIATLFDVPAKFLPSRR